MGVTCLSMMSYEKRKACVFFVKTTFLRYDWLIAGHLIGGKTSAEKIFLCNQKNVPFLFLSICNGGIIELSVMYSVKLG